VLGPIAENKILEKVCLTSHFLSSRVLRRIRGGEDQAELLWHLALGGYAGNDLPVLAHWKQQTPHWAAWQCANGWPLVSLWPIAGQLREAISNPIDILSGTAKFWLKLNARGRKGLLSSPGNSSNWINTIIGQKSDHRVTFCLMRLNPRRVGSNGALRN